MSEEKRPLKVFLCHAHVDKDAAKALHDRLVQDGVDAWLDKEKLFAGSDWNFEIRKAVRDCDIFVVCVSEEFTRRFRRKNFSQTEVGIALNEAELKPKDQIYIIPVRLESCAVPKSLQPWHWVDLFEPDGYQKLIRSLNKRIEELDESEAAKGQLGQGNISVVVNGGVSGNLIVGDHNIVQSPVSQPAPVRQAEGPKPELSQKPLASHEKPPAVPHASPKKEHPTQPRPKITGKQAPPQTLKSEHKVAIIVAILGLIGTLCAALIGILPQFFPPAPVPTATSTPTVTATFTNLPPSVTPTKNFTPTPTPLPTEIVDAKGVTMRLVPAGEFTMGSDNYSDNEKPAHKVYLGDFYMDIYEVTNALYKDCVEAGICSRRARSTSYTRSNYYGNPEFDNYPVIYVNWEQAKQYCEWRGARLPTEAEWEKAARGGLDGKNYPWGDVFEDGQANFCDTNCSIDWAHKTISDGYADTSPVGIYPPNGYGLHDMSGNVWEWVADWYDAYPGNTIINLEYGTTYRVLRGGSWSDGFLNSLRVSVRYRVYPSHEVNAFGFRCVR